MLLPLCLTIASWFGMASSALAQPISEPVLALFSFSGPRPTNLGLQNGSLADCPSTPNCVNSQTTDQPHGIAPLRYTSTPEEAFANLKQTIQAQPRTKIVGESENYLYAESTSQLMGFVDDVEFYLDKNAGVIQVRSASRLGESDLGVNRQRIESIRTALKNVDRGTL
ncbi:MAG: DUF1499 domain-containing protein [Leptolyngbyaceae cyanobacterium SU_3_3]|nr:DUF1499 domain-containing protein [Leptolyngbyaceae cyanobacterium SU_3_3]